MKKPSMKVLLPLGLALTLCGAAASAENNERGRVLYGLCVHCHGEQGGGNALALAPAIAGLGEWYVKGQLEKFRSGIRGLHADDIAGLRMYPMSQMLGKDEDLAAALASIKTRLKPGGLLLLSIRDYDALVVDKPRFNSEHVQDRPDGRRIVFQVWDWASDGCSYRNRQFLIKETDGHYEIKHFETELRALLRDEVMTAVRGAGYEDARWHVPEASDYYQPIVTARKR